MDGNKSLRSHAAPTPSQQPAASDVPLVVKLEWTLVKTSLLVEAIARLLRARPWLLLVLPFWLARGRARLEVEVGQRIALDPAALPYHEPFLAFLRAQHANRRTLVLASAADSVVASAVAAHLGIFARVISLGAGANVADQFRGRRFDYAGNAGADLPVWQRAHTAILVNPSTAVERRARLSAPVGTVYSDRQPLLAVVAKAIRIHQWVKNLLVVVPIVAAHRWSDAQAQINTLTAFFAFSLCASAIYLLNDMADLDADRTHPRKKRRPLAAGNLPLAAAAVLALALLLAGTGLGTRVSRDFALVLGGYVVTTTAYSFVLKSYVLIDVLMLAALYSLRVIAGAVALAILPSFWLIAFSMFLFTSLALVKRCAELESLSGDGKHAAKGRDYRVADLRQLTSFGNATGNSAIVVLAFYINSPEVTAQYRHPEALWLLCPLLMYWIGRMWIKSGRGEMHDDPIVYSAKDKASWVIALVSALTVFAAL
jgi:4-hydroxybenzoate polyprenyltransferase